MSPRRCARGSPRALLPLGERVPAYERLLFGLANFIAPGVLLALVVIAENQGLSGGQVGLLVSVFGVAILLGAFLSPLIRRRLPIRGVLLLELWTWVACGAFVIWPSVYVLTASIVPSGIAIASTDSVVRSYQLALAPDRLLGRVGSVQSMIALLFAPHGPLVAGYLLGAVSQRPPSPSSPRSDSFSRCGDLQPLDSRRAESRRGDAGLGRVSPSDDQRHTVRNKSATQERR